MAMMLRKSGFASACDFANTEMELQLTTRWPLSCVGSLAGAVSTAATRSDAS